MSVQFLTFIDLGPSSRKGFFVARHHNDCAQGVTAVKHFTFVSLVFVLVFVMFAVTAPIGAAGEDLERDALVALYNSTNGDGWLSNYGWLDPAVHYCNWFGVTCDDENRVTILFLSSNNLSRFIPSELGNLRNLNALYQGWNQLACWETQNVLDWAADHKGWGGWDYPFSGDVVCNPLVVTKTADTNDGTCDADCSLREAVEAANSNLGNNRIIFDVPAADPGCSAANECTVVVTSELQVNDTSGTMTIDSTGTDITISGNNSMRILYMQPGTALTLKQMTLSGGCPGENPSSDGGAIYIGEDGKLIADESNFLSSDCDSQPLDRRGGAIYADQGAAVTITKSNFSMNIINGYDIACGGAIYVAEGAELALSDSSFFKNSTGTLGGGASGGAICNFGTLTILGSVFEGNHSVNGGAIRNLGTLNVVNSTFSENITSWRYLSASPGAIANSGTLNAVNSTFFGNSSELGCSQIDGGTLTNSILANGTSIDGGNCCGGIIDGGGNISDDESCGFTQTSSRNNTDPRLDPVLANNGGPTMTHALWYDSPAIDTAVSASCPATDQRGVDRPQGAGCDSGAFELVPDDLDTSPVANPDNYAGYAGQLLVIAAPGVLENDTDADGDSLTAVLSTDVQHGTLALSSDGSFTYNAEPGYIGNDSFLYYAFDGRDQSEPVTVTITINPSIVYLPVVLSE